MPVDINFISGNLMNANLCLQNAQFLRYVVNRKNASDLSKYGSSQAYDSFIQLKRESTICVGEANFFQVDYTFVWQVRINLTFFLFYIDRSMCYLKFNIFFATVGDYCHTFYNLRATWLKIF